MLGPQKGANVDILVNQEPWNSVLAHPAPTHKVYPSNCDFYHIIPIKASNTVSPRGMLIP